MTYGQGIRIASRTFAAYLLCWAIADLIYLPRQTLDVAHALQGNNAAGLSVLSAVKASFFLRVYILYLTENVLRIALCLMVAGWFYRGTPRIQRFFTAPDSPTPE